MPKEKHPLKKVEYDLFDLDKEILDAFIPLYNYGITPAKPLNPLHVRHSSDEEPFDYDTETEEELSFSSNTDSEVEEQEPQNALEEMEKEARDAEIRDIVLPKTNDYTLLEETVWREDYKEGQLFHDRARDKWFEDEGCIATAFGYSMCAYSIWTFPQLCQSYGGMSFCVMSLIVTCIFTIPVIYMELVVGQFRQKGTIHCSTFCPIFQGVAYVMMLNAFIDLIVNTSILSYFALYTFESLKRQLSWANCSREWTTTKCVDLIQEIDNLNLTTDSRSPAVEFFRARILRVWKSHYADDVLTFYPFKDLWRMGKGDKLIPYNNSTKRSNGLEKYDIYNLGITSLDLIAICFVFYITAYVIIRYRVRFMGAVYFFILFVGYIALALSFVYGWIQPYGRPASREFFNAKKGTKNFFRHEAWAAAVKHGIISSGLGTGMYFTIGSHQRFDNRRIKVIAFAAGFGSWITHFLLGLLMSIYWYGTLTYRNTGEFANSYFGNDSVFEIFPMIIAQGHSDVKKFAKYYSTLFYFALICLSCVRSYGNIYMIKTAFTDSFKHLFDSLRLYYDNDEGGQVHRWERYRCMYHDYTSVKRLLQIIIGLALSLHIVCFTRGGIYVVLFLQTYGFGISHCLALGLEILAFNIMWGARDIDEAVEAMTGIQSTFYYRIAWKYFCPQAILFYFAHYGFIPNKVRFDGIPVFLLCHFLGLIFGYFPLLFSLIFFGFRTVISVPLQKRRDKFKVALSPEYEWICLTSGQLRLNRTHWLHYVYFPVGFSRGKGASHLPEEMYNNCTDCGKTFRTCCLNNCSCGIYKRNLFFIRFASMKDRPPSIGKPLKLAISKQPKVPPVVDPHKQFIRDLKNLRKSEDVQGTDQKYLTVKIDEFQKRKSSSTSVRPRGRSRSSPDFGNSVATRKTLQPDNLRNSILSDVSDMDEKRKDSQESDELKPKYVFTETLVGDDDVEENSKKQEGKFNEEDDQLSELEDEFRPEDLDDPGIDIQIDDYGEQEDDEDKGAQGKGSIVSQTASEINEDEEDKE